MKTYVVGCDGASGVSRDKLELHVDLAEQILVFGLKSRTGGFVERKGKKLAVVKNLSTSVPPCNLKVLV